jgi:putative adhesin
MPASLPMTTGRWIALAIGTPLALAFVFFTGLGLVAAVGEGSYRVSLTLPVAGGKPVSLTLSSSDVTIGPAGGHSVLVRGVANYALARSRVTWHHTSGSQGTRLSVNSSCRQITGDCSFNLNVGVPVSHPAVISASSGTMTVHDLHSRLTLRSHSGDVAVARLTGAVNITDESGNVTGTGLFGGTLTVHQDSGDTTISGLASPEVTAVDRSGNVLLSFSNVPSRVVVHNGSGDVEVVLPPGATHYRVEATTDSGSTSVSVPRSPGSPHVITVTNHSGNVTVVTG